MARPIWHVLAAAPPVALAWRRGGLPAALAAGSGAVLIDVDHAVDWLLNGGRQDYTKRIVVPLHGWEFPGLLLAAGYAGLVPVPVRHALRALAAGWTCHLLLDFLVNRPEAPAGYSVLHRLRHRFQRVPSGWLPEATWGERRGPYRRAAPRETAFAAALAILLLLAGDG